MGWGTFGGRFGFWISLVLILLIFNRIRLEEHLLAGHFGQAYEAYKARPKRLVPFVF
jgi:protein-S-isoprenylcysteine O-methyltransferase Ste14